MRFVRLSGSADGPCCSTHEIPLVALDGGQGVAAVPVVLQAVVAEGHRGDDHRAATARSDPAARPVEAGCSRRSRLFPMNRIRRSGSGTGSGEVLPQLAAAASSSQEWEPHGSDMQCGLAIGMSVLRMPREPGSVQEVGVDPVLGEELHRRVHSALRGRRDLKGPDQQRGEGLAWASPIAARSACARRAAGARP